MSEKVLLKPPAEKCLPHPKGASFAAKQVPWRDGLRSTANFA